jgi:hypothetical protein
LRHHSRGEGGSLSRLFAHSLFPMKRVGSVSALRLPFSSGRVEHGLSFPWTPIPPPRNAWGSWNCRLPRAADTCNESSWFWFWISYLYVSHRLVTCQIKPGLLHQIRSKPNRCQHIPERFTIIVQNQGT